MKIAVSYLFGAILLIYIASVSGHPLIALLAIWSAISLLLVSAAYAFNLAMIFRKRRNGRIPLYIKLFFVPFLLGAQLINIRQRHKDKVPALQQVEKNLYLACRLMRADIESLKAEGVRAVLDVTCEFDGLDWSLQGEDFDYLNIPVLDHAVPSHAQLNQAIRWIHRQVTQNRPVVVHCALGRGRSVMVMAAYMLSKNPSVDIEDVLEKIRHRRETAQLNARQLRVLQKRHQDGQLVVKDRLALIANPGSGSGDWKKKRDQIESSLSPYFELQIYETSKQQGAIYWTKKALDNRAEIVVACGGDGTVTEVARALIGSDIPLGIIPLGTANALSYVLYGMGSKLIPVEQACEILIHGATTKIDTAQCNDQSMLLLAGIGFEQHMAEEADSQAKNSFGQLAYMRGFFSAIVEGEIHYLQVSIDEKEPIQLKTTSLVVANAAPFSSLLAQGKGEPELIDGYLDITWIKGGAKLPLGISLAELIFKAITSSKVEGLVKHQLAKSIRIRSDKKIEYVLDGDLFETELLEITIQPKSLKVLIPENSELSLESEN